MCGQEPRILLFCSISLSDLSSEDDRFEMSAWSLAKRAFDLFVSLCDILVNTILTEVKSRFLKLMYGDVASSADFFGMGE